MRGASLHRFQYVRVAAELHEKRRLGHPGAFRLPDFVVVISQGRGPLDPHEEIGDARTVTVREFPLVDDRVAGLHGRHCQCCAVAPLGNRIYITPFCLQLGEDGVLVLDALLRQDRELGCFGVGLRPFGILEVEAAHPRGEGRLKEFHEVGRGVTILAVVVLHLPSVPLPEAAS